MDWQAVVEQLMELERFPVRRMQAEKALNDQKSGELGVLGSRMGTLKASAESLTNADLWNARATTLSDVETTLISASAATGTLVGEYVVSDATRATASVLSGDADLTTNIVSTDVLNALNVTTSVTNGTFTINGTIFEIVSSGASGNTQINETDDLATLAAQIVAELGITAAGVSSDGRFFMEDTSQIILGHPDDTSNLLSVLKLFTEADANFNTSAAGGAGVFSAVETASTTEIIHRQGDYVYYNGGYYPVLQDAPRGSDLSTAPNDYFGNQIVDGNDKAYTITGITGTTGDTFQVDIDGNSLAAAVSWAGSVEATATALKTAIDADATLSTLVHVSVVGEDLVLSEKTGQTTATLTVTPTGTGTMTGTEIFDTTQTAPAAFYVRSEYAIGSVDVTQSIRDALGIAAGSITYAFDINGESFTVKDGADTTNGEIDIDNSTLSQFMDKVTASDAGITLSYNPIEDRFVLTSKTTGEIKITTSDTTNNLLGLMQLDSSATATLALGEDATLTINGTVVTSNSNAVGGEAHGIDGLTINVLEDFATTDKDITVTVASTTDDAKTAINNFIAEYNSMQRYLEGATETTTTDTKVETSIFSDNLEVSNLISSLRYAVFGTNDSINPVTMSGSGIERIQDIGIDFISGSAELQIVDSTLLDTVLSESGTLVKELFASAVDEPSFYSSTESYSKGEIVEYDGVYWIALQATTGNSPPSHDGDDATNNIDANWSFYAYDDNVARDNNTTDDHTGTPILNGLAYGMAYRVIEHINNYLEGTTPNPDDTETDGSLELQTQALSDANDQLDDDIAQLELLLEQREQQMTNSFIRMEEAQSQIQSQQQMLDSSIQNNFGQGAKK